MPCDAGKEAQLLEDLANRVVQNHDTYAGALLAEEVHSLSSDKTYLLEVEAKLKADHSVNPVKVPVLNLVMGNEGSPAQMAMLSETTEDGSQIFFFDHGSYDKFAKDGSVSEINSADKSGWERVGNQLEFRDSQGQLTDIFSSDFQISHSGDAAGEGEIQAKDKSGNAFVYFYKSNLIFASNGTAVQDLEYNQFAQGSEQIHNFDGSFIVQSTDASGMPVAGTGRQLHSSADPSKDIVRIINGSDQLTQIHRPDGSLVLLTYPEAGDPDWNEFIDSQTNRIYVRTATGVTVTDAATGANLGSHKLVEVTRDGAITVLDDPINLNDLVHFDQGVDPELQKALSDQINSLPNAFKDLIVKNGTFIQIQAPDPLDSTNGYYSLGQRAIVIGSGTNLEQEALAHELAHVADATLDKDRLTTSVGFTNALLDDLSDPDRKSAFAKHLSTSTIRLMDPPERTISFENQDITFGVGDLYAEIVVALMGRDQSGEANQFMSEFPALTAYIKNSLGSLLPESIPSDLDTSKTCDTSGGGTKTG